MYFNKLGFFQEQAAHKHQNKIADLNLFTTNLKNNTLRRMLFAYLRQELNSLMKVHSSKQARAKQKRLLSKLKFTSCKRRAKNRFILKINPKIEVLAAKPKKASLYPRI